MNTPTTSSPRRRNYRRLGTAAVALVLLTLTLHSAFAQTTPASSVPAAGAAASAPTAAAPAPAATPLAATNPFTTIGLGTTQSGVGGILGNNEIVNKLAQVLALLLRAISQLLWPLLMFAGGLMKSDFLYTGAMDQKLSELWVQVRNLVNILYVLLLLAAALYNILGLENVEFLQLKKALPKIIIGLLLVNFSYTGFKVVLDVVNVGTTFAFSLPRTSGIMSQASVDEMEDAICKNTSQAADIATSLDKSTGALDENGNPVKTKTTKKATKKVAKAGEKEDVQTGPTSVTVANKPLCSVLKNDKGETVDKTGASSTKPVIGFSDPNIRGTLSNWNIDSGLAITAMRFMKMQQLDQVAQKITAQDGLKGLTINLILSLAFYLTYAVSFLVLTIVLFTRAAALWIMIICSPIFVLNLTFPNVISGLGGGSMGGKVVKTLIAPMIIGFVLSVGFMLLSTIQNIDVGTGVSLDTSAGIPTSGIDTFQDILLAIGSTIFIWIGIEAAIKDTIGDSIAGSVMTGAKTAGKFLAKAPFYYTPFFAVKGPKGAEAHHVDMGTVLAGLGQVKYNLQNRQEENARKLLGLGTQQLGAINKIGDLNNYLKRYTSRQIVSEQREDLKKVLDHLPDIKKYPELKKAHQEMGRPGGGDPETIAKYLDEHRRKNNIPLIPVGGAAPAAGTAAAATAAAAPGGTPATKADITAMKATLERGKDHLFSDDERRIDAVLAAPDDATVKNLMTDQKTKIAFERAKKLGDISKKVSDDIMEGVADVVSTDGGAAMGAAKKQTIRDRLVAFDTELEKAGRTDEDRKKEIQAKLKSMGSRMNKAQADKFVDEVIDAVKPLATDTAKKHISDAVAAAKAAVSAAATTTPPPATPGTPPPAAPPTTP